MSPSQGLVLLSYHTEHYNKLPDGQTASRIFRERNGAALLDGELRALFARHPGCEKEFAVTLLHRHFDLQGDDPRHSTAEPVTKTEHDNEVMVVSHNGVSMPWPRGEIPFESGVRPQIVPAALIVGPNGALFPYEFAWSTASTSASMSAQARVKARLAQREAFVRAFYAVLEENDLDDVLGLGVSPYQDVGFVLENDRKSSPSVVALEMRMADVFGDEVIESLWGYQSSGPDDGLKLVCRGKCLGLVSPVPS